MGPLNDQMKKDMIGAMKRDPDFLNMISTGQH